MADKPMPMVAVNLPAELVAKMEDLKKDRKEDRGKSIEELVRQFCQSYTKVREMARWESTHREQINRSYTEHPNDWDDADVWGTEFKQTGEDQK